MKRSIARTLALVLSGMLVLLATSCGNDERQTVVVEAETQIRDPIVLAKVEGDFVAPDRNRFIGEAFRRFESGDVVSEEHEAVTIGDRAWLKSGESWEEQPIDDPDVLESVVSTPWHGAILDRV